MQTALVEFISYNNNPNPIYASLNTALILIVRDETR